MEAFVLSRQKRDALNRMLARELRRPIVNPGGRGHDEPIENETTEVYIAKAPEGGIPALDPLDTGTTLDDIPGQGECDVYKILRPEDTTGTGAEDWELARAGFSLVVFNLGAAAIAADSWILIAREKYGRWIVTDTLATPASDLTVEEEDGDPSVTGVTKIRLNQDHGYKLVDEGFGAVHFDFTGSLTIYDIFTDTTFAGVRRIEWDSTPLAYNSAFGDIKWEWVDEADGIIKGRLNGFTGITDPAYDCIDNKLYRRNWDIRNGSVKTIGNLYTNDT